jgi:hypothetical protein
MRRLGRWSLVLSLFLLAAAGCGPRVLVVTGTTLGLKATPGDPQAGQSPQVTLGYKRAETSLVPTGAVPATVKEDAYSTLAVFSFDTTWFGKTNLSSFISTGFAAQALTSTDAQAAEAAKIPKAEVPAPRALPGGTGNSFADAFANELKTQ